METRYRSISWGMAAICLVSHAGILRLEVIAPFSRRSWGGTRGKPKDVCVGGYHMLRDVVVVGCTRPVFMLLAMLTMISLKDLHDQRVTLILACGSVPIVMAPWLAALLAWPPEAQLRPTTIEEVSGSFYFVIKFVRLTLILLTSLVHVHWCPSHHPTWCSSTSAFCFNCCYGYQNYCKKASELWKRYSQWKFLQLKYGQAKRRSKKFDQLWFWCEPVWQVETTMLYGRNQISISLENKKELRPQVLVSFLESKVETASLLIELC